MLMVRRPLGAPVDLRQSRRTRPFLCDMSYRVIPFIQTGSRSRQGLPAPGTTPAPAGSGGCPRRRRSADARTTTRPQAARPEPVLIETGGSARRIPGLTIPSDARAIEKQSGPRGGPGQSRRPGRRAAVTSLRPPGRITRTNAALRPCRVLWRHWWPPGCTALPHKRMKPRNLPGGTAEMIDWRIAGRRPRRGINRLLA